MSEARAAKASFFRQSGWMIVATVVSGVAMMLVHTLVSKKAGELAYAEFRALLSSFYVVAAVGGGLWTLFAQQTAAAVTPVAIAAVAGTARKVLLAITGVWLVVAVMLWMRQEWIVGIWKLSNPASLWATWLLALLTLWTAVIRGLVQGQQQFFVLGWIAIFDGLGRFVAVWVALTVFAGLAAGAMTAAVVGVTAALLTGLAGAWQFLQTPGGRPEWRLWLTGFVPLAGSAAALQLFQQYDQMFWQAAVPRDELGHWKLGVLYMPAQAIGFAIVQFTVPLALVMLPRLARSAATGEASDALKLGLLSTAAMSGGAALGCTLFPSLPLRIMFFNKPENWEAAPLVPWFAWSMTLFALANVFLSDLFARRRFGIVWGIVLIAGGYIGTLSLMKPVWLKMEPMPAFRGGVMTLMGFNLTLLVLTALWSFASNRSAQCNPAKGKKSEGVGTARGT